MQFNVNMKQFQKNWQWDTDTVEYGNQIALHNGTFFTLRDHVYKRLLTDFNIFFTASSSS